MNVTDEQKEKLKCKIEGRERNLRRERVIKAGRVRAFFIWGLAGAIFYFFFELCGQWVFSPEGPLGIPAEGIKWIEFFGLLLFLLGLIIFGVGAVTYYYFSGREFNENLYKCRNSFYWESCGEK